MKLRRLQKKNHAFYRVTTLPNGKRDWERLGSDEAQAMKRYFALENKKPADAGTVEKILDNYLDSLDGKVKPSSIATYGYYKQNLVRVLGNWDADELPPQEVAAYLLKSKRRAARDEVRFLSSAFAHAILTNPRIKVNPAVSITKAVKPLAKKVKRYVSDAELELIIKCSTRPMLGIAIEIAYATALRVSDVLKLQWNDFGADAAIIQQKTGDSAPRQRYPLTTEIQDMLARARKEQTVRSIFVIAGRGGRPIKYKTFWQWFDEARSAAKLDDVVFHDIRRKAGTDRYNQTGGDISAVQKLLGHASQDTSVEYLTGVQINTVEPMKRRKA